MEKPLTFTVPLIRFAQQLRYPAGYYFGPQRFYDHCWFYIEEGEGVEVIEGKSFRALPDRLFLIPPRVSDVYQTGPRQAQISMRIHFDWEMRSDSYGFYTFKAAEEPFEESLFREPQCVPGWDWKTSPYLDLRGRPRVRQLLHEVIAAYAAPGEYSRLQAGAILAVAITQVAHEVALIKSVADTIRLGADAVRRAHRARELLETVSAEAASVAAVAETVGWGPDHLARICREVFGASPHEMRTQARLRRAQELLRYSSLSVGEVGAACGYGDISHFTRIFKKQVGVVPSDFMRAKSGLKNKLHSKAHYEPEA